MALGNDVVDTSSALLGAYTEPVIGWVITVSVAMIVAALMGNILLKMAIGGASRSLTEEMERIGERRAKHAMKAETSRILAAGRDKDVAFLERQQWNS